MLGFIPAQRARVLVAHDGALAAIEEPTRITLVTLPRGEPFGVVQTETSAFATDVGWLGSPSRLLVLARRAMHTQVRVVDPRAPRLLAERELAGAWHLRAWVDDHAVLCADAEAMLVSCPDGSVVASPLRLRTAPAVAGAADRRFVFVAGATIVECDPIDATTRRTWRIPATESVTAVGGSARVVWRTTREAPARIAVIPLVTRGQPKIHDLPEPIVQVAGHPRSDVVACLGESGHVHVIDLDGATAGRVLDTRPVTRADAIGLRGGVEPHVVACEHARPTAVVPLALPTWREELVAWTRSGVVDRVPVVPAIVQLGRRLALPDALTPALTLCYGAYLCGAPGVPPDALAEVLGGRWPDEARGRGRLAATGGLVFGADWIALAPAHRRMLDEL